MADGKQTVVAIMGMTDFYIVDRGRERLLAQPIQQVIQLVVVSITRHRNSFSRKMVIYTFLFYVLEFISF